jgi:hypothetical protein
MEHQPSKAETHLLLLQSHDDEENDHVQEFCHVQQHKHEEEGQGLQGLPDLEDGEDDEVDDDDDDDEDDEDDDIDGPCPPVNPTTTTLSLAFSLHVFFSSLNADQSINNHATRLAYLSCKNLSKTHLSGQMHMNRFVSREKV